MKKLKLSILLLVAGAMALPECVYAQKDEYNPVETGVVSLGIAPDARAAAMGDLGAATDPDAYSQFWNPSKYAFAYSNAAVSISYTPWLRKIVNDIFLADIAGYWKLGGGDNQAVSASLRYFSLGEVSTYSGSDGYAGQTFNPYEMAFDLGYSRKLSESYSMGIVFRYVYSALGYNSDGGSDAGDPVSGASAFAADISGYLTKYPIIGQSECQWSFGWNISNIGSKLNFDNGTSPAFLPTNLRLGTNFAFPLADYHTLSIGFDANKLLVPTKPRLADYDDEVEYQQATIDWENTSSISGIFKSFSDAPGGAKEELQEITWSLGAEYSYNNQFFLRAGYYYENEYKGGRKYYGLGAGFALNVLRLDASYMIAASQNSPLDQTLRFSLTFDMDGLKEIFGGRR